MKILGISAYYHDSSAAIVEGTKIVAAAQEERFTRKKNDSSLPVNAINFCLSKINSDLSKVDGVVFYENPFLKLSRQIITSKNTESIHYISKIIKSMLQEKIWVENNLRSIFGKVGKEDKLYLMKHHLSHAASAFYPSNFENAAIITIDGVGEWNTTTIGVGHNNKIRILKEINFPHSLGLLYSAFTYYCGFKVNSGEYKLMGLAPYGIPKYTSLIKDNLIDIKDDGSFKLNTEYFGFLNSDKITNDKFGKLFNNEPRKPDSDITQKHMDIAASIQKTYEDILFKICYYTREITNCENLVMAGGGALNCVANGKILNNQIFKKVWIQPAAGDAGGSLGAALAFYFNKKSTHNLNKTIDLKGSLLGPSFSNDEILNYLNDINAQYTYYQNKNELHDKIADYISKGKIVGYFNGSMEFGPRALGARSILADPRLPLMQCHLNQKIKFRESFRPFAPAIIEERLNDYFNINSSSPYMLLIGYIKDKFKNHFNLHDELQKSNGNMLKVVSKSRSIIPGVTHVDFSARIQSVTSENNPDFYSLLKSFEKKTSCPVLINTSFNIRGEPIVCTPKDAYICFMKTGIDILILENILLLKTNQPKYREQKSKLIEELKYTKEEEKPKLTRLLEKIVINGKSNIDDLHKNEKRSDKTYFLNSNISSNNIEKFPNMENKNEFKAYMQQIIDKHSFDFLNDIYDLACFLKDYKSKNNNNELPPFTYTF